MSRAKKTAVALSALTLLVGAGAAIVAIDDSASATSDAYAVAPYVDLSTDDSSMLTTAISRTGLTAYTAAFVTGSGCTPVWGDALGVDDSAVTTRIAAAQAAGASVIIAFGGSAGTELARSCTDTARLTAAYQQVVTTYGVDHVDFDIEGASLADTASIDRRYRAIRALEDANPSLDVSVTIPVPATGPDRRGAAFLQAAAVLGARIDLVNALTVGHGASAGDTADVAEAVESAAAATLDVARAAGLNLTYAGIGVTPTIGVDGDETLSQTDARAIVAWAHTRGVGRLAFWSIGRDRPCGGDVSLDCSGLSGAALDFTRIFLAGPTSTAP